MTNNGYVYHDRISTSTAFTCVLDFYAGRYPRFTRARWRERIESGQICVNGVSVSCDTLLKPGDELTYHRPPWTEPHVPLTFHVHYVDDHLLVVGKPAGLPVLPRDVFLDHTLLVCVRRSFGDSCTPMHRLDRGTSGLVLFTRTLLARKRMGMAMQRGEIDKTYIACVSGERRSGSVDIRYPIGLQDHLTTGKAWGVTEHGRASHTRCRFIHRNGEDEQLVMAKLITGRPHQIRIHLSALGNALVGDPMYGRIGGKPNPSALPGDTGFFLHAWRLRFKHPISGQQLRFTDSLPSVATKKSRGDLQ